MQHLKDLGLAVSVQTFVVDNEPQASRETALSWSS